MNELTIKSRTLGKTFRFWMPVDGGYIRLVSHERPGTLGEQITKRGGATISATPADFEAKCRRWYRSHLKTMTELGQI